MENLPPEYSGKQYADGRPTYPEELFQFVASKTPCYDLCWDVGTGNGQAARSLAKIFKNVVATDVSLEQLEFADKLPNIRYQCTPPKMSIEELEHKVAAKSSVDLIASAEAMHWFDLPNFFQQVRWILKKPNGVIAAWCYSFPEINDKVDSLLQKLYTSMAETYFNRLSELVLKDRYKTIDFPFEPVDGLDHTGPFEFKMEKTMDLEGYFMFIKSWSSYKAAKGQGVEFLSDGVVEEFRQAWNEDGKHEKMATYPIYLRIGKGCEKEVVETEPGALDEVKSDRIMRLSWALVHSIIPEDVQRGIAMLEASLSSCNDDPVKKREKLYLLAVGYYRSGDYLKSRKLVEICLQVAPDWRQGLYLKEIVEDHITKDGVIGIGITATALGLIVGGIMAAVTRRN